MPQALGIWFCGTLTVVAFWIVLPWMARRAAIYQIHNERDRLYALREQYPQLAKSLVYMNSEAIVTMALRCARHERALHLLAFSGAFLSTEPRGGNKRIEGWQYARIEAEIDTTFADPAGRLVLTTMKSSVRQSAFALAWLAALLHPLHWVVLTPLLLLSVGVRMLVAREKHDDPREVSAPAVPLRVPPPPPTNPMAVVSTVYRAAHAWVPRQSAPA